MLDVLRELSFQTEIGLLTGSGLEYIKEQLWPLLADQELSLNCHVLPCNGIEYYIPNPESPGNFIEIHRNSMEAKLGFEKFQFVMTSILKLYIPLVIAPFIFLIVGFSSIDESTIDMNPYERIDMVSSSQDTHSTKDLDSIMQNKPPQSEFDKNYEKMLSERNTI